MYCQDKSSSAASKSKDAHVTMREKKSGALTRVQKLKKRLSHSFGRLSISKEEAEDAVNRERLPYNGYSEEFLDRLEQNGNIPSNKQRCYDWSRVGDHERVHRQLSVSSDSKLLDEDIREEAKVILRPRRPPRPKSEVFLVPDPPRRTKRFSAFGGDSPFGKSEAYMKLEQLGEGSYATVFKGFSHLTNQVVALKEIRLQEEEGAPFTAIREASLLKELKHNNIVTLHDIIHTRETLTFVFEYVHTDLSQYMERYGGGGGLDPHNVKLFLFQLLRGLAYCHKRRVLHRDVKPQNLLISEIGELKLADFGLARAKSVPSHTYSHEVVTLWYRPPDVLLGSTEYSTSLDMWGVGCIFVEMLTGVPTFPGVRCTYDQLDKIFKILGTPTEETWPGVTHLPGYKPNRFVFYPSKKLGLSFPRLYDIAEVDNMATSLLQLNPDERIGAQDALHHSYFASLPRKLYELPDVWLAALSKITSASVGVDECQVTPVIHVLQYAGCVPKPIPSFACIGRCSSYVQVSGSKIWQMERSCMCCQESGEREAGVSLFCPKAKTGGKKFRKLITKAPLDCMCRPCPGIEEYSVIPQEIADLTGNSPLLIPAHFRQNTRS